MRSTHYPEVHVQGFFQEMCQGGANLAMKNMWGASLKHYRLPYIWKYWRKLNLAVAQQGQSIVSRFI